MSIFYISPTGSGLGNGSGIANAGTLADLPAFIAAAGPDGKVLLLSDQGSYAAGPDPIVIAAGGIEGHPVTISGIDSNGDPANAEIFDTRSDPWTPGADSGGGEVLRLLTGADNLVFENLSFSNIGYAAFRVGADIANLTIQHVQADNVIHFLQDYVSGSNTSATISGLTIRDVQIAGYSKAAISLGYDTHDVLIEDVRGDSEFTDGDNFAIGVHLDDTAHDVVLRRVTMRNALDTVGGSYRNGDGFATERGNYNILFEDTVASGNSDGGYDIKSTSTKLVRTIADGNTHNYRLWSNDVVLEDVVSLTPSLNGSLGGKTYDFWVAANGHASIVRPFIYDVTPGANIFNLTEANATADVIDATVTTNASAALLLKNKTSSLSISYAPSGTDVSGSPVADYAAATGALYLLGGNFGQTIISGSGADKLVGGAGADLLNGGQGDDVLIGGGGNDLLQGGDGADVLIGGAGFDLASYTSATVGVQLDLVAGAPGGGAAGDLIEGIEGLVGSSFADTLRGDAGVNLLAGGDGADLLDGRGGDDVLIGGAGGDRLIGGAGFDTADYSASALGVTVDLGTGLGSGGDAEGDSLLGIERVVGSAQADQLFGGVGDDRLVGGAGADLLDGRGGFNTADYADSMAGVIVDLAAGTGVGGAAEGDRLTAIGAVLGSAYDDSLTGDGVTNLLAGGAGADRLDGAGGDDRLLGGLGADTLIGGDGEDIADYAQSLVGVTVDLLAGTGAGGDADEDTLYSLEDIAGSAFADVLIGDAGANVLDGGAGDDRLLGNGGGDSLIGGTGIDTADYSHATQAIGLDLATGQTTGDAEGDVLSQIEIVIGTAFADRLVSFGEVVRLEGGAGDDALIAGGGAAMLIGGEGDDSLTGGVGDDLLIGGAGADAFQGGEGTDTASYADAAGGVAVDLTDGIGTGGEALGDTLDGIEVLIGSRFDDVLVGAGNDRLVGGAGADMLDGAGFNTVDYSASAAAVTVDLSTGIGSGGDAEGDRLTHIEALIGSRFNDVLIGDAADNRFVGGAGADRITGADGSDTIDYSASAAAVVIDLAAGTAKGGDAQGDILVGVENLVGTALADTLVGNGEVNRLEGGAGADTLNGGANADILIGGMGDDQYIVDAVGDEVVELAGEGTDRVQTTLASYTLTDNVENLLNLGKADFSGTGNALENSFTGGIGNDTFFGLDGDDKMRGSTGADTFFGGAGENIADYSAGRLAIAVNLMTNDNHGGDAEGDLLYDITIVSATNADDSITGNDANNKLYARGGNDIVHGGGGNDTIDGGAGDDVMYGDAGNDIFYVDSIGDQAVEGLDEGIDTVRTSTAAYTLGDNVENLSQNSNIAFTGTGNQFANLIVGNILADVLDGGAGNDTLRGQGGGDQLIGGEGQDTADYATSLGAVQINLATGEYHGGDAEGDTFDSIENVAGSAYDDRIEGDDGANLLNGAAGNDLLSGGAGDDILVGGGGADRFIGGAGSDYVTLSGALADYRIGAVGELVSIEDLRTDRPDGNDVAREIEGFVFADGIYTLADVLLIQQADRVLALSDNRIVENALAGTTIGTVTVVADGLVGPVSFALLEDDAGRFAIDATSGIVSARDGARVDYEQSAIEPIVVVVTDAEGTQRTQAFAIAVTDVNESPTATRLDSNAIAENVASGTVVGQLVGADPDAGDVISYTLIDDAGGRFALDALGRLVTAPGAMLDYEDVRVFDIVVRATDSGGLATDSSLAISLTNVVENQVVSGTAANDTLLVTSDDNWTINGLAGVDRIATQGGADVIRGGAGDDSVSTGGGNDTISFSGTGEGFDTIDGGTGVDRIVALSKGTVIGLHSISNVETITANGLTGVSIAGSAATDLLDFTNVALDGITKIASGAGNDVIRGSAGADVIVGGTGEDILSGGGGNDRFLVGSNDGVDRYEGGDGYDAIVATAANARVSIGSLVGIEEISSGGFANMVIVGSDAADMFDFSTVLLNGVTRITTGNGDDTVIGSAGNDVITGGAGIDRLSGGGGNDQFQIVAGSGIDIIDGGDGYDMVVAAEKNIAITWSTLSHVEAISGGGYANVDISGTASSDTIDLSGYDLIGIRRITGGAGNDKITGSAGADVIVGGTGSDILVGGAGDDVFLVAVGDAVDTIDGGADQDVIRITSDRYVLLWGSVKNVETVDASAVSGVTINGGVGDDLLDFSGTTLTGIASILASSGRDVVIGSAGADRIVGGGGADQLTGGGDADIFAYNATADSRTDAVDRLLDFQAGSDLIDLSAIDASTKSGGNQAFSWIGSSGFSGKAGELATYIDGSSTFLSGDVNGDRVSDFLIELVNYSGLTSADIIL